MELDNNNLSNDDEVFMASTHSLDHYNPRSDSQYSSMSSERGDSVSTRSGNRCITYSTLQEEEGERVSTDTGVSSDQALEMDLPPAPPILGTPGLHYASLQASGSDSELYIRHPKLPFLEEEDTDGLMTSNSQSELSEDGYNTNSLGETSAISSSSNSDSEDNLDQCAPILKKRHSYLSLKDETVVPLCEDYMVSPADRRTNYRVVYCNDKVECLEEYYV